MAQTTFHPRLASGPRSLTASRRFFPFFATVVVVQGVHVIEHIIQLLQVYAFGVADDDAFGVLGAFIKFNDTEEWLHLAFNFTYLMSLFVLAIVLREYVDIGRLSRSAYLTFVVAGVGLETWHMTEHVVIIANVMRNSGCPCPGIGDRALGVTDTVLHFVYNLIAYAATVVPFAYLWKSRRPSTP